MPDPQLEALVGSLARLPDPDSTDRLTRSLARVVRFQRTQDGALLAPALSDFLAVVRVGTVDSAIVRWLVLRQLEGAMAGYPVDCGKLEAVLDEAGDDPGDPGAFVALRGMVFAASALNDQPGDVIEAGLRTLDEIGDLPADHVYRQVVESARLALLVRRAVDRNDLTIAPEATEWARRAAADVRLSDAVRARARLMAVGGELLDAAQRGDLDAVRARQEPVQAMMDDLPADDPAVQHVRNLYELAFASLPGPKWTAPESPTDEWWHRFTTDPGLTASEQAYRGVVRAIGDFQRAYAAHDLNGLYRVVDRTRAAVRSAPADNPNLVKYLGLLGGMLQALYEVTHVVSWLTEAVDVLERARREAGSPSHPAWATLAQGLSEVYQGIGRARDARVVAFDGLRGHTWNVLLQQRTVDATDSVRDAVDDAVRTARLFLEVDDIDTAATALDAGRGLLLYSASVSRDLPERLERAGAPGLAADWRREGGAPSDPSSDLRYRALSVLAEAASSDSATAPQGLLEPLDLAEVRAALGTLGADALVYLVAATTETADSTRTDYSIGSGMPFRPAYPASRGVAIVVPRSDSAFRLDLPDLTAPPQIFVDGPAPRALRDLARRRRGNDVLAVCDWAWTAAIGPLLDALPSADLTRLVLIPFGALAAVPWHAARSPEGSYAVERAAISYAASARLLCRTTWRPPITFDEGGMVVANPTGDLTNARTEALAVRDAFYPRAELIGTEADPAALLDWLQCGDGRSTLHLACHGVVGSHGGDESYLLFAGDRRLTAAQILETRERVPVEVVTLAACTTAVAGGAYDEAFSLSTAFLVAGAQTVFGSLWAVPDDATSLLIFMTHHYVRIDGLRPAEALRRAQLWMLDPDREPPATMPSELAAAARVYRSDRVESWAGFTHVGR